MDVYYVYVLSWKVGKFQLTLVSAQNMLQSNGVNILLVWSLLHFNVIGHSQYTTCIGKHSIKHVSTSTTPHYVQEGIMHNITECICCVSMVHVTRTQKNKALRCSSKEADKEDNQRQCLFDIKLWRIPHSTKTVHVIV